MNPLLLQQHIDNHGYFYQKEYDVIISFINDLIPDRKFRSLTEFKRIPQTSFENEKRNAELIKKYSDKFKEFFDITITDDIFNTLKKVLDKISYKIIGKKTDNKTIYSITMK